MPINFDTIKTTRGREYRPDNIAKISAALGYLPIKRAKYNNVFYEPATYAEHNWKHANGIENGL